MNDRVCIRGCTVRGVHFATCDQFGAVEDVPGACRGCAPREARDKALICERCYQSVRRLLEDAGDIVGHLRSIADPSRAQVYDRVVVQSSRPDLPAPVAADLVDASDDIARTVRMWEMHVEGDPIPGRVPGLPAGTWAADAHAIVAESADVILDALDRIVNVADDVVPLCDAVLTRHNESSPEWWSLADAAARWPFEDQPRWADAACPECDLRSVRVQPPRRRGAVTRYACTNEVCGWTATSEDDEGLWASHFREEVPLGEGAPHDPRRLTLAAAARRAGVTTGTMRAWAARGRVAVDAGRYWAPDVDQVIAERAAA